MSKQLLYILLFALACPMYVQKNILLDSLDGNVQGKYMMEIYTDADGIVKHPRETII